jgi:hypothetical protein
MKAISLSSVLVYLCIAKAFPFLSEGPTVLDNQDGIDLNLQDLRLVEMEGQPAVWMTELEKVWCIYYLYRLTCLLNASRSSRRRGMASITLTCKYRLDLGNFDDFDSRLQQHGHTGPWFLREREGSEQAYVCGLTVGCQQRTQNSCHLASCPQSPNKTEIVRPILNILSEEGPRQNLAKFTSFRTRCEYHPLHSLRS